MTGTWGYTDDGQIWIPDDRIPPTPGDVYLPLRGCGYSMAVRRGDRVIGYIMCDDLGYDNVKAWVKAR